MGDGGGSGRITVQLLGPYLLYCREDGEDKGRREGGGMGVRPSLLEPTRGPAGCWSLIGQMDGIIGATAKLTADWQHDGGQPNSGSRLQAHGSRLEGQGFPERQPSLEGRHQRCQQKKQANLSTVPEYRTS